MSDTVVSLADYRRATPRLVHSAPAMPRAPRPGLCKGDHVRIKATGAVGWISDQRDTARGLVLTVRVNGIAVNVSASGVVPLGAA